MIEVEKFLGEIGAPQQKVSLYAKWFHLILSEFIGFSKWGLVGK
jgi:hypothetical protein